MDATAREVAVPTACRSWSAGPVSTMRAVPPGGSSDGFTVLAAVASGVGSWVVVSTVFPGVNRLWIDRYDPTGRPTLPVPSSTPAATSGGTDINSRYYDRSLTWIRSTSEVALIDESEVWLWPGAGRGRGVSISEGSICCFATGILPDAETSGFSLLQSRTILRRFRADGTEFARNTLPELAARHESPRVLLDDGGFGVLWQPDSLERGELRYAHYGSDGSLRDPLVSVEGTGGQPRAMVAIPSGVMLFWDQFRQPPRGLVLRNDGRLQRAPFALTADPIELDTSIAAVVVGGEVLVAFSPNSTETEVQRRSFQGEPIGAPVRFPIASRGINPTTLYFTATDTGALLFASDNLLHVARVVAFSCVR